MNPIQSTVKSYVLEQFLPGANAAEITESTPLITGGLLDSLATIRLVAYLENQFDITIDPAETGVDNLDTLDSIAALVERKRKS
ncbi:MAG TPA: acyl carrier protein [Gemmatimonadaceae bacterium]